MSKSLELFITNPTQMNTLKSSGFTETQRREFTQFVLSLEAEHDWMTTAQPMSIFNVVLKLVKLKLSPELETAYVIPYFSKEYKINLAQLQIGYKGYIELAMRTGLYKEIECVPIKDGDYEDYDIDTDTYTWNKKKLSLEDVMARSEKPTLGYRAFAHCVNGDKIEYVMFMKQIQAHHKQYSKAYAFKQKPQNVFNGLNEAKMDRKTVIKMFIKGKLLKNIINMNDGSQIKEAIKVDDAILLNEKGSTTVYPDTDKTGAILNKALKGENE